MEKQTIYLIRQATVEEELKKYRAERTWKDKLKNFTFLFGDAQEHSIKTIGASLDVFKFHGIYVPDKFVLRYFTIDDETNKLAEWGNILLINEEKDLKSWKESVEKGHWRKIKERTVPESEIEELIGKYHKIGEMKKQFETSVSDFFGI